MLTKLDDIAWLFNLRGNDIEFNPVFFSYAWVSQNEVELYVDEDKLEETAREVNCIIWLYVFIFFITDSNHEELVGRQGHIEVV